MVDRQVLIDGYLLMVTPKNDPIPIDDGSGLDLPSDLEMALYVATHMLAEFERDNGIDCDDNQYREAILTLTRLVHDVGTGSVLQRCANVLGVCLCDLANALEQCPDHVAQLFGHQKKSVDVSGAEQLARRFHETYERLAPDHGYETREASAKPWDEVPDQNRNLMIAVCRELIQDGSMYRGVRRDRDMARILGDLDRCQHGRRAGDPCAGYDPNRPRSGCAGGVSHGNPFLVPGQPVGYDMFGNVYALPDGGDSAMNPYSWEGDGGAMPPGYEHPDDDPERRISRYGNLLQAAEEHLKLCPVHDGGIPGHCSCVDRGDHRSVILALVQELELAKRGASRVTVAWASDDLFEVRVGGEEVFSANHDNLGRDGMHAVSTLAGILARRLDASFSVEGNMNT